MELCETFGISLPTLPVKGDHLGKTLYYSKLNLSFYEFRQLYEISPSEMCAFLYGFSIKYNKEENSDKELPRPSKVWLLKGGVGGEWDPEFVDNATEDTIAFWAGNLEIRKGDICLMYLLSPRKYIHSVWRANSDGYIDPFFYFHTSVKICKPIKVTHVYFKEMKEDPLLSQKGHIKAQFQGPSGITFSVEEYNALLGIMERKGQDISILPKLEAAPYPISIKLNNERDVEIKLIEPFLQRLGYSTDDWIRQMPIKMGRGERNYPDYAFGANSDYGEESARMILESKYQIRTQRELRDAYYQTKSYALRLRSKVFVLASEEGIWIFVPFKNDFVLDRFVHKNWNELTHPDVFHEVMQVVAKRKIIGK